MNTNRSGVLTSIVSFSLRFRGTVIILACIMLGYGIYMLLQAKYDVFPEFAPPQVVIQTEAPGLSPEQVEMLVTQPLENAINGVEGIETLRSGSIQGLSVVTVVFHTGSDIYRARQILSERLTGLYRQMPQGIQAPAMTPLTSSTSVVLVIGLTSESRSLMEIRTTADWIVKQRLLSIPGVAKVAVFGGEVKQFQIQVSPERLIKYHLSIEDVLSAAHKATGVKGAGFIENNNQRIILQSEGQSLTASQIARTVIYHRDGANVILSDVAEVAPAPEPPIGAAAIMGRPGVQLVVSEQYGANTLEVTDRVEDALTDLRPMLEAEGIAIHTDIFRPANFIKTAISNVRSSLLIGAALVAVVLFLFLLDLRTAAISCTAIPLSLLAAVTVFKYLGYSLNTMTLGGLAIAVGVVVDDAIIDVENILRRLMENRSSGNQRSVFQVVLDASIEVRNAIVYATFAVILVFIPVLTMSGVAGQLFSPLGIAFILAIFASLLVALTVTPALCFILLGSRELSGKEPPVVRWLKEKYSGLLVQVKKYPRIVIGSLIIFTLIGLSMLPFFGGGLLPELREGHFIIHMSEVPGTSIEESLRLGQHVTEELLRLPFVRTVSQRTGRAERADDTWGTHYSELNVDLKPLKGEEGEFALVDIRKILARFLGVNFSVKTFLTERVEETISGYTASVAVNLFGNNLDILDKKAQEIDRVLSRVSGAIDVQVQSPPGVPQIVIRLRKDDLMRWGFNPVDALDVIRTAYQGDIVGQVYDGNRVFDVSVILNPQSRKNIKDIGTLPLLSPNGVYIQLKQICDIYETSGRYIVLHQGARRVQTITCNASGRDINSFVREA
ncbi:MAG: efflux RND transporter permease subunit, partial [Nitrospirae bacterium]|nr:efflux RND transporter permease subunit [Nitrospirota bacterium]